MLLKSLFANDKNKTIGKNEQADCIERKCCSVKEFAKIMNISESKAYQFTRAEGFPYIKSGRKKLIILSKVDQWLEEHIGQTF